MKLWIDDQLDDPSTPNRHSPKGWVGARSSVEAIAIVESQGLPEALGLDHDLGDHDTVMVFLKWLAETFPQGPVPTWSIHSENVEGRKSISAFLSSWEKSLTI